MISDRIKAHRWAPDVYDAPTFDQMADRIEELEAKLAKAVGALVVINALAPESMVNGYSQSDLTEIVSRMGKVTRTTLIELKGQDDEV